MSYHDQYIMAPAQPAFSFQPPTPINASGDAGYTVSSSASSSSALPMPIPMSASSSRASSRAGTPSSSRGGSARHHPYSASPASWSEHSVPLFRPQSATSASEYSTWDSDASSFDMHGSSFGSYSFSPASSQDVPTSRPSTASSPYVADAAPPKIGRNGKPVKSHSRKQAPGHIKRPPNAFILFRSHCCAPESVDPSLPEPPGTAHARYLASLEINNSQHISMIVSQVWNQLKPEEKEYWDEKARLAKEEHARLHPDYRYRPQQRTQETVRRRKKPEPKDRNQERNACTEVAQQVLKLDAATFERRHEGDLAVDYVQQVQAGMPSGVAGAGAAGEDVAPVSTTPDERKPARQASPRKTRTRPAPAKSRAKVCAPAPAPSASPSQSSSQVRTVKLQPTVAASHGPSFGEFSYLAPPGSATQPSSSYLSQQLEQGDFSASAGRAPYGRRTSHTRTQPLGTPDEDQPFAFVAQLESHFGGSHFSSSSSVSDSSLSTSASSTSSFPIDPRLEALPAPPPYPHAAFPVDVSPFESHFSLDPSSTARPPTAYQVEPVDSYPPSSAPGSSRPMTAHDDPLSQMQNYTLGGPSSFASSSSSSSSSSFGSALGDLPKSGALLAERRAGASPAPLDALQRRRGTLRASDVGAGNMGDLMLISPLTTTFNGRRQSIGWQPTVRRVSLAGGSVALAHGQVHPQASTQPQDGQLLPPAQAFCRRSSLSTTVISAEQLDTVTFSQALLDTIPSEGLSEGLSHYSFGDAPSFGFSPPGQGEYDSERPSTADSAWSTDDVERLECDMPVGFYDRRRSTIVASKFMSASACAASSPSSQGYHAGSEDFFVPPNSALSSAPSSFDGSLQLPEPPSFDGHGAQPSPAFGSPKYGGSFQPQSHFAPLTVDSILAAATAGDVDGYSCDPLSSSGLPGDAGASPEWLASTQDGDESGSAMHTTALSVLNERRQHFSAPAQFAHDLSLHIVHDEGTTYVYLTLEQMKNEPLMTWIKEQGYGIAVLMPSPDMSPPLHPSPEPVPPLDQLCLSSPSSAPSVL
ncbi:hypothetical protein JCM8208_002777 [Rhodotorula glutinis]